MKDDVYTFLGASIFIVYIYPVYDMKRHGPNEAKYKMLMNIFTQFRLPLVSDAYLISI